MFELGRKPFQVILVVFLDRKSQRMSVPTDRQTLSMHRYLQLQGFCCSVGRPLNVGSKNKKLLGGHNAPLGLHTNCSPTGLGQYNSL